MADDDLIAEARLTYLRAHLALAHALREACPGPHRTVQHRDGRPPWCGQCRYTAEGLKIEKEDEQ